MGVLVCGALMWPDFRKARRLPRSACSKDEPGTGKTKVHNPGYMDAYKTTSTPTNRTML